LLQILQALLQGLESMSFSQTELVWAFHSVSCLHNPL
jgi:hypothetical protein